MRVFTVTMSTVLKILWKNYIAKAMNSKNVSFCEDSRDVAINIAGYVTKEMLEKSNYYECKILLKQDCISSEYLDTLSRGGLIKPSKSLAEYVCTGFALLDSAK